jgi:hypothetical protein
MVQAFSVESGVDLLRYPSQRHAGKSDRGTASLQTTYWAVARPFKVFLTKHEKYMKLLSRVLTIPSVADVALKNFDVMKVLVEMASYESGQDLVASIEELGKAATRQSGESVQRLSEEEQASLEITQVDLRAWSRYQELYQDSYQGLGAEIAQMLSMETAQEIPFEYAVSNQKEFTAIAATPRRGRRKRMVSQGAAGEGEKPQWDGLTLTLPAVGKVEK